MKDSEQHDRHVETQSEAEQQELSNDVFASCTALYAYYLKLNPQIRGRMNYRAGEAEAIPNDFMADCCIKAKRCLLPVEYAFWVRLGGDVEASMLLTEETKDKLRMAWRNLIPGYYKLFKTAQKLWDAEAKKLRRQAERAAKALDDNAFALYEAERAAELLTQEDNNETAQEDNQEAA